MTGVFYALADALMDGEYKIKDCFPESDTIVICYQLHQICIAVDDEAPNEVSFSMVITLIDEGEDRVEYLEHCNILNRRLRHLKFFVVDNRVVSEVFITVDDLEDVGKVLSRGLDIIGNARRYYRDPKLMSSMGE